MNDQLPSTPVEGADLADRYDRMLRLADLFDAAEEMRLRSSSGRDPARRGGGRVECALQADLRRRGRRHPQRDHRHARAADPIDRARCRRAGGPRHRADLPVDRRAARAAYTTLGSIAGRAIGYLAPGVALGGAIVSAGLIETDALDRDGIADYLSDLAEANPDLMDHVTSGGGGLVESLQLRSLLTSGLLAGDRGRLAAAGGLRAIGVEAFAGVTTAAVRDVAGPVVAPGPHPSRPIRRRPGPPHRRPRGADDAAVPHREGHRAPGRRHPFHRLPARARRGANGVRRLRLVGGDPSTYAAQAVTAIEAAVKDVDDATVMLVGSAQGGVAAAEIAAAAGGAGFTVDQVVTAGAPSAQVPALPKGTRMLSLEDRADPVALLGSLLSAAANRLVVVFDAAHDPAADGGALEPAYVVGGRAADRADNADLRAEIDRIQGLGYPPG